MLVGYEHAEATSYNTASKCLGAVELHALRRGYVTEAL